MSGNCNFDWIVDYYFMSLRRGLEKMKWEKHGCAEDSKGKTEKRNGYQTQPTRAGNHHGCLVKLTAM